MRSKESVSAIVQARVSSRRYPGKMLKYLGNKMIIEWVISRLKKSKKIKKIVLASSSNKEDKIFVGIAKRCKIDFFLGDEENVLKRYFEVARKFNIKNILRVCADNPFISASEIDLLIKSFFENKRNYSFNNRNFKKNKFADGFGAEIISFESLKFVFDKVRLKNHKEHVTSYLWDNHEKFIFSPAKTLIPINKRYLRADVDTESDLQKLNDFISKYKININSSLKNIIVKLHKYEKLNK